LSLIASSFVLAFVKDDSLHQLDKASQTLGSSVLGELFPRVVFGKGKTLLLHRRLWKWMTHGDLLGSRMRHQ
jgi:hypothetical protein